MAGDPAATVQRPGAEWAAGPDDFEDIRYETSEGIAKITITRPEVRTPLFSCAGNCRDPFSV